MHSPSQSLQQSLLKVHLYQATQLQRMSIGGKHPERHSSKLSCMVSTVIAQVWQATRHPKTKPSFTKGCAYTAFFYNDANIFQKLLDFPARNNDASFPGVSHNSIIVLFHTESSDWVFRLKIQIKPLFPHFLSFPLSLGHARAHLYVLKKLTDRRSNRQFHPQICRNCHSYLCSSLKARSLCTHLRNLYNGSNEKANFKESARKTILEFSHRHSSPCVRVARKLSHCIQAQTPISIFSVHFSAKNSIERIALAN